MGFFDAKTAEELKKLFSSFDKKVGILLLTQPDMAKCQYCRDIESLYGELAGLTDKISLEVRVLKANSDEAKRFGIMELTPVTIILDETEHDTHIRFYGVPAGYEFTSLIETLLVVSTGKIPLMPATVSFLRKLDTPVDMKIFVSTTCPYCPQAVFLGHLFALVSAGKVTSSMVEVAEYPFLATKYTVMGVPRIVINEKGIIEGAPPEEMLLAKLKETLVHS